MHGILCISILISLIQLRMQNANKPNFENLAEDNWETLCTYWNDPIVKVYYQNANLLIS